MKAAGIVQTVTILLLLASAASCEVGKEYSKKVFESRTVKKTPETSLKFLDADSDTVSTHDNFQKYDSLTSNSLNSTPVNQTYSDPLKRDSLPGIRTKKMRQ